MSSKHIFALLAAAIVVFSGCYTKFAHYDFQNSHLVFGADGGRMLYDIGYALDVEFVDIDGEIISSGNVESQSMDTLSVETYNWLQFAWKRHYPNLGPYHFIVQPNLSTESRSAVIHMTVSCHQFGEIYITQEGCSSSDVLSEELR
ncbi:MAG: hypothetical protein MJZ07_06870 [Bacteroidales bacterium]|nr:hypothetical protein [Bacteroidales bacterium]